MTVHSVRENLISPSREAEVACRVAELSAESPGPVDSRSGKKVARASFLARGGL